MTGYLNRPDETRAALRDGWLHTGDQARIDEEGHIFIVGRNKDMMIFRGMNIYPREIEGVLESHPAVREAAVVGRPDATRGEIPFAFVSLKSELQDAEGELRRHCIRNLARYKVPRGVVVLPDLPRNPAGKVIKSDLRLRLIPQEVPARRAQAGRAPLDGS
jgi:acyl-CoA synthetase (AMP-forming)/AMP-acid ligase II